MVWRSKAELTEQMNELVSTYERAADLFYQTLNLHFDDRHDSAYLFGVDGMRKFKTEADNGVDAVRTTLYSSSFPVVRDELMVLAHTINLVVEDLAHLLFTIRSHRISASAELRQQYRTLLEYSHETIGHSIALCRAFILRKQRGSAINELVTPLFAGEKRCDEAEQILMKALFAGTIPPEQQLEESAIIERLGAIADRCKKMAHHIEIITLAETE